MADPNIAESLSKLQINPDQPRYLTELESEAKEILKGAGCEIGSTMMAGKIRDDKQQQQNKEKLITNVYGITVDERVKVYRYDIKIEAFVKRRDGTLFAVDMEKKLSKDAFIIAHRNRRRAIFNGLSKISGNPISEARCVYYDLESILFSLDELKLTEHKYEVPTPDLAECAQFARCTVSISTVKSSTTMFLGDLTGLSLELNEVYRTLAQFLDIATGQHALFDPENHVTFSAGRTFLMDHEAFGFKPDDVCYFENDSAYLAIGCDKAVRYIEGPGTRGTACSASVIVQTKKTPFHATGSLLNKAKLIMPRLNNIRDDDRIKLDKVLKGLVVETQHGDRSQKFAISAVSRFSARTKMINVNNKEMSVEQYFKEKYGLTLAEPNVPLIEVGRKEGQVSYFPMEICDVSDNQRVTTQQLSPKMTELSIRKCAVPPAVLIEQNKKVATALNLWNSDYLKKANVQVATRPTELNARIIAPPRILFGNNTNAEVKTHNFTWMGQKYVVPTVFEKWTAIAFFEDRDRQRLNMNEFQQFVKRFTEECQSKGIQIPRSEAPRIVGCSTKEINKAFEAAYNDNILFVLAIHMDGGQGDIPHYDIKYAERQYGIVSQCISLKTLQNVVQKNQRVTLQNIVNKTNVKFGGLNYTLSSDTARVKEVLQDDTLYIGFGSNHPGGGMGLNTPTTSTTEEKQKELGQELEQKGKEEKGEDRPPTVVGYSANIGPNGAFDFVGDFYYQEPRREEKISVISEITTVCAQMFERRRGALPKRVIIYRGGCSDGQFQSILKYEVPLIKVGLDGIGCSAAVSVVAVNKLQNVRLFKQDINRSLKPPEQNIQPGTVVNHTIVHPLFAEFFLNSHRALQGTARTPKYTVVYDDNKLDLSRFEEMTYLLCFSHQVVFLPTSIPSPVYIANCYADRGRVLYQRWIAQGGARLRYGPLTDSLQFASSKCFTDELYGFRVNA